MEPDAMILVFWMLSFKPTFSWVYTLERFYIGISKLLFEEMTV